MTWIHSHTYIHIDAYIHSYRCIHTFISMHTYIHLHTFTSMPTYIHLHTFTCIVRHSIVRSLSLAFSHMHCRVLYHIITLHRFGLIYRGVFLYTLYRGFGVAISICSRSCSALRLGRVNKNVRFSHFRILSTVVFVLGLYKTLCVMSYNYLGIF